MKKLLLLIITFTFINTCTEDLPEDIKDFVTYEDIYELVKSARTGHVERKAQCITNSAARYNLDPWLFAKLGLAESSFCRKKVNWNKTCYGIYQINTKFWSHLPYRVFDRKYAKYLRKHKGTNLIKVLTFIGVNTECGAIVLRDALDKSDNDYEEAFLRYGGFMTKKFNTNYRDRYIKKIMYEN